ncbi:MULTISPECIES: elongator complex protein 3 [unclassified Fusibacter]|uniref:elongator complex protein 3 n=1 Tax=unclassified Fusibacter TaxID=2624464 RepID=UPI001012A481|nr:MULTISPECIES: radical SAM protein [unclassified Fusibacter]MCK8058086.1 radical SAM protein [Fusibacter sp. A2]NPE20668.1 radical SAM protein [Fusibacter sp. A1]RXV62874.1 radical SAM protein [Fusibacter sp. A1]
MRRRTLPFFVTHQGCPHQCVFCNQRVINNESAKEIEEFDAFIAKFAGEGTTEDCEIDLAFFGGSFTGLERELMKSYLKKGEELLKAGRIHSMKCSTRPDCIDEEILELLKAYGMNTIELGVQSMSDTVLSLSERGLSEADIVRASELIKEKGFVLGHQIMIGLPGDTFETFKETVRKSIELKPDVTRIYPTQVLKGTELAKLYENGDYVPLTIEKTIEQAKWALQHYYKAGVKVIKVGLHANDDLMDPDVRLAGPYHPAFREWVESLMVQEILAKVLTGIKPSETALEIRVHPKWVSRVSGLSQLNKLWLEENYRRPMRIIQDTTMSSEDIIISSERIAHVASMLIVDKQ